VHFAGQQAQDELPYYFNAAELVVLPSHYESFGMVAAEALACGVPVVTTNVTGVSRLMDRHHSHLITTVQNPLLLAKQMAHVLSTQTTDQTRATLRATVADLTWHNVAQQVHTVYLQSIDRASKHTKMT
jgi:D-inositol-3-phosphate glycosyltransferase